MGQRRESARFSATFIAVSDVLKEFPRLPSANITVCQRSELFVIWTRLHRVSEVLGLSRGKAERETYSG